MRAGPLPTNQPTQTNQINQPTNQIQIQPTNYIHNNMSKQILASQLSNNKTPIIVNKFNLLNQQIQISTNQPNSTNPTTQIIFFKPVPTPCP
jgi:hypothetical protein